MIKKINILLVLLLLVLSIGAVSAFDDVNGTVNSDEAIDSEIIASEEVNDLQSSSDNRYTVNSENYNTYFNEGG